MISRALNIACLLAFVAAVAAPPLQRKFVPADFVTTEGARLKDGVIDDGVEAVANISILVTNDYTVRIAVEAVGESPVSITLKIDGIAAHRFEAPAGAPTPEATVVHLPRGLHNLSLRSNGGAALLSCVEVIVKSPPPP